MTPFWKFVIHCQTWTATTCGIDQTRTSAEVSAIRTQVLTRTSSSPSRTPITIVRPTFAIVKTIVRSSVCQKTWSCSTSPKLCEPDVLPLVLHELEEPVLLEREATEAVDRIAEDRHHRDDHREDQQVRHRRAADPPPGERPPPPRDGRGGGGWGR